MTLVLVNKPINLYYFYLCIHIFLFFLPFLLFCFLFFILFFIFLGLGPAQPTWAGLDRASPARLLAQASDPAGQSTRELDSRVHGTVRR